jgi:hypothetical protein
MAVSKSTQARIGFATMVLLALVAIGTPTLITLRSGEIGAEEVSRPGAPIYALHAILRHDEAVGACLDAWGAAHGGRPERLELTFVVKPDGNGELVAVGGIEAPEDLEPCLSDAIEALDFPPYEGEPVTWDEPFTP